VFYLPAAYVCDRLTGCLSTSVTVTTRQIPNRAADGRHVLVADMCCCTLSNRLPDAIADSRTTRHRDRGILLCREIRSGKRPVACRRDKKISCNQAPSRPPPVRNHVSPPPGACHASYSKTSGPAWGLSPDSKPPSPPNSMSRCATHQAKIEGPTRWLRIQRQNWQAPYIHSLRKYVDSCYCINGWWQGLQIRLRRHPRTQNLRSIGTSVLCKFLT